MWNSQHDVVMGKVHQMLACSPKTQLHEQKLNCIGNRAPTILTSQLNSYDCTIYLCSTKMPHNPSK